MVKILGSGGAGMWQAELVSASATAGEDINECGGEVGWEGAGSAST